MTKSLTEQWKDGELETGHYYIQWSYDCDPRPSYMIDFFDKEYNDGEFMLQRHKYIDEVLAPVPSYDEYKRLQEQLKAANRLIKSFDDDYPNTVRAYLKKWGVK